MKFYCDSCQTKYSIADEKVRGKVLKVRCKKCSHVITVREPRAPVVEQGGPSMRAASGQTGPVAPSRTSPPKPPPVPPAMVQWYYSINGQSFGPLGEKALFDKFGSGELGDATYVWNERFADWKPVRQVQAFAEALEKSEKVRPSPKTHGISQALEAIERPEKEKESPKPAGTDQYSQKMRRKRGGPESSSSRRGASRPEESRRERLANLRRRLRLDEDEEEPSWAQARQGPRSAGDSSIGTVEPTDAATPEGEDDGRQIALAATLADGGRERADGGRERAEERFAAEGEGAAVHDGLFSEHDRVPTPEAGGDAAEPIPSEDHSPDEKKDAVPFFPSAPKLGGPDDGSDRSGTMSRVDEITGSLLIQINAIKKGGRKRAILGVVGGLALLAALGAVVYFASLQFGASDDEADQGATLATDHIGQRPEFHEYTQEELAAVRDRIVLDETLVVSRADGQAALEREESGDSSSDEESSGGDLASSLAQIDTESLRYEERELGGTRARDDSSGEGGSRFSRPGMISGDSSEPRLAGAGGGDDDDEIDDRFRAMAAVQTETQRGVYGDEYGELNPVELREGLAPEEIADGIRSIMDSVGICRERHIYGGGTELPADKIQVSITVTPDGRVGRFDMSPAAVKDTHFGRCMNSHTRRWGFPRFKGEPVEIQAPFALQ